MKTIVVLLFLVSCSDYTPNYKYGDCILPTSDHFYSGTVFQLRTYSEYSDYYTGCRVDGVIDCESFKPDEIEQTVNCPIQL